MTEEHSNIVVVASRLATMPARTPGLLGRQRPTVRAGAATEREALTRVWAAGRRREAISPLTQTAVRRQETAFLPHGRLAVRCRETTSPLARQMGDRPEAVSPLIPRKLETTSHLTLATVHRPEAVAPLGWEAPCRHGTTSPPHGWVEAAGHAWPAVATAWAVGLAWAAAAGEGRARTRRGIPASCIVGSRADCYD